MEVRPVLASAISLLIVIPAAAQSLAPGPSAADASPIDASAPSRWPSLGGDYARCGLSRDEGPLAANVKWKVEIGGAVVGSVTVGSGDRIHVASEDGRLYTLDPNGAIVWVADIKAPLLSAPSIAPDGSLVVGGLIGGARQATVYAIDPNGKLRWAHDANDVVYASPAIAPDGTVYIGSTDGTLRALRRDGTELWRFYTKGAGRAGRGAVLASPSIGADGTIYAAGLYDPNLYALDPETGNAKWACTFESDGWPFSAPIVAPNGVIYQTLLYDSHLYAIEPNGGTILWSTDLAKIQPVERDDLTDTEDSDGWSEPVIGPDGTIYVSLDDPHLRAVDPKGRIRWTARLGDVGAFTLTVDRTGLIYAASDDGCVYIVDSSGSLVNRFDVNAWPVFPVITADDTLIVTDSKDFSLLATDAKNVVWAIGQGP